MTAKSVYRRDAARPEMVPGDKEKKMKRAMMMLVGGGAADLVVALQENPQGAVWFCVIVATICICAAWRGPK